MRKIVIFLSVAFACAACAGVESTTTVDSTPAVASVKHYEVITSFNHDEFNSRVNLAIEKGFVPIGGVSTVSFAGGTHVQYSQAVLSNKKQ